MRNAASVLTDQVTGLLTEPLTTKGGNLSWLMAVHASIIEVADDAVVRCNVLRRFGG